MCVCMCVCVCVCVFVLYDYYLNFGTLLLVIAQSFLKLISLLFYLPSCCFNSQVSFGLRISLVYSNNEGLIRKFQLRPAERKAEKQNSWDFSLKMFILSKSCSNF